MKIKHYSEISSTKINNDLAKNVEGRILIGKSDGANNFCMRIFDISPDGHTPKHTHDWEHELFFHSGNGKVFLENEFFEVSTGTAVFIPSNIEHQIINDSNEHLMVLCLVPSFAPEL